MLSIDANLAAMQAWLESIELDLSTVTDDAVVAGLEDLIQQLIPVTPVRTGAMRDGYRVATGEAPDVWLLVNIAERTSGRNAPYPYPRRVIDDPDWSAGYGPLNLTLEQGIDQLTRDLDVAVTRLLGRAP